MSKEFAPLFCAEEDLTAERQTEVWKSVECAIKVW
jgi:hypothetical protein